VAASQAELQNASDAAALAGVQSLMDGYMLYAAAQTGKTTLLNTALDNARNAAKKYAGYNAAGEANTLTLQDSDVEFGFIDSKNNYTPQPAFTGFPNSIKVTLRRDSSANNPLKLFFAPILGSKNASLATTASATMYGGALNSFKSGSKLNSAVL